MYFLSVLNVVKHLNVVVIFMKGQHAACVGRILNIIPLIDQSSKE